MNHVALIGRITKDIELRRSKEGNPFIFFALAVNSDREMEKVNFIQCVAWNNLAETISNYCHKGSRIAVQGEINTFSKKNDDGSYTNITNVSVNRFNFLDTKQQEEEQQPVSQQEDTPNYNINGASFAEATDTTKKDINLGGIKF